MSGVETVIDAVRLISESDKMPRALFADTWADGTVLLTVEDTETGYPLGQINVTYAELAAFAAIVAELERLGVITDE